MPRMRGRLTIVFVYFSASYASYASFSSFFPLYIIHMTLQHHILQIFCPYNCLLKDLSPKNFFGFVDPATQNHCNNLVVPEYCVSASTFSLTLGFFCCSGSSEETLRSLLFLLGFLLFWRLGGDTTVS